MSSPERSPLLSPEHEDAPATESSPLLGAQQDRNSDVAENDTSPPEPTPWYRWSRSNKSATKSKSGGGYRWPSIIAITVMGILIVVTIILGFIVPPILREYTEKSAVIEPTDLKIENVTPEGVRARVWSNFRLESDRVEDDKTRRIGKFATMIFRHLKVAPMNATVYLPQYNNLLVGQAAVPELSVNVLDGHNNQVEFLTDLTPGDADDLRTIANDWLDGNIAQLKISGKAPITFRCGIIPFGTHDVIESMTFEADELPSIPDYQIERLDFHDIPAEDGKNKSIGADVSVILQNDYPLSVNVPSLGFEILVPNCDSSEPYIMVAEAVTEVIEVRPRRNVTAHAKGVIRELSDNLTRDCPPSKLSPLDQFMKHYLHGEGAEIFIRAKSTEDLDTPDWIGGVIENMTVPLEFPGKSLGNMIRNFSLADVDFQLPSPFADPNDPASQPRVSGVVQVLAALPSEMNVDIGVKGIQANANLFYEKRKFGELNLDEWQKASSTKVIENDESLLNITSKVVEVPLDITDGDVFGDLMAAMLFGSDEIMLDVKSTVDVKVSTVLGHVVVKEIPAQGKIPVQPLPGNSLLALDPQMSDLQILDTSDTGLYMQALVNFSNPTPYTASVPYFNIHIIKDGHMIGEAVARDVNLQAGNNTNVMVRATWDPLTFGGEKGRLAGRGLLSDYVSNKNSTITLRTHRDTVPSMPVLGEALSKMNLTIPAPRLKLPADDGDDGDDGGGEDDEEKRPRFVRNAEFHILSSTAAFTLASPLHHNTIYLDFINATAIYNHTEPVGQIIHDRPFAAPPGLSNTPRLAVEWSASHVGYDKVKEALGGSLKLDAVADVTIRLGNWIESLHYHGQGIGAKVRL